jgi:hypothetical protein
MLEIISDQILSASTKLDSDLEIYRCMMWLM